MNEKELCAYRMADSELLKWNRIQSRIICDCKKVEVPSSFGEFVKAQISPTEQYAHVAGYCNDIGYFYVSEGDRGELFLKCLSKYPEDIRWCIMEKILINSG